MSTTEGPSSSLSMPLPLPLIGIDNSISNFELPQEMHQLHQMQLLESIMASNFGDLSSTSILSSSAPAMFSDTTFSQIQNSYLCYDSYGNHGTHGTHDTHDTHGVYELYNTMNDTYNSNNHNNMMSASQSESSSPSTPNTSSPFTMSQTIDTSNGYFSNINYGQLDFNLPQENSFSAISSSDCIPIQSSVTNQVFNSLISPSTMTSLPSNSIITSIPSYSNTSNSTQREQCSENYLLTTQPLSMEFSKQVAAAEEAAAVAAEAEAEATAKAELAAKAAALAQVAAAARVKAAAAVAIAAEAAFRPRASSLPSLNIYSQDQQRLLNLGHQFNGGVNIEQQGSNNTNTPPTPLIPTPITTTNSKSTTSPVMPIPRMYHSLSNAMTSQELQKLLDDALIRVNFNDITVTELKELLRQRRKSASGKKDALIERLMVERDDALYRRRQRIR